MVTPKCGRSFRREVNASSALRTIERTSASFRRGLRSDHLHNNTVFHRRDSLQHSLAKDTLESSGKWRFTNYCILSWDFSNWILGTSASSFFKYYLCYVTFQNGWKQWRSSNNWTSSNASSQFKLWRKETERILSGPLHSKADRLKLNQHFWILIRYGNSGWGVTPWKCYCKYPFLFLFLTFSLLLSLLMLLLFKYVYIWAGAHNESLINARLNEDPELRITTTTALLDHLAVYITHSTFFRENREELNGVRLAWNRLSVWVFAFE